jgi:probable rRNA maturation factor
LSITFENTDNVISNFNQEKIRNSIRKIIIEEGRMLGEIAVIFLTDKELIKINRQFLNHVYYTDIITFEYNRKDIIYGDIYISTDSISTNAKIYKTEFFNELLRVIFHGILHLIGYKDISAKDKNIMHKKENYYLEKFRLGINE